MRVQKLAEHVDASELEERYKKTVSTGHDNKSSFKGMGPFFEDSVVANSRDNIEEELTDLLGQAPSSSEVEELEEELRNASIHELKKFTILSAMQKYVNNNNVEVENGLYTMLFETIGEWSDIRDTVLESNYAPE